MTLVPFIARRIAHGIIVLWTVATVVFFMYFVAPNDVARLTAGRQADPATVAAVTRKLGLNRPLLDQYVSYLGRLIHGNLGYSFSNTEPVNSLIHQAFPVTLSVAIGGAVLWLILGVGAGVLAAVRRRTVIDRVVTALTLFFYSMPTFLLGELLLLGLFYELHLAGFDFFSGQGYVSFSQSPASWAQHLLLPWLTIALVSAATYARLTRASLSDVLEEDYIRTARAKGLSSWRIITLHGLRSALTPIVTQFGLDVGTLLGGVVVTEEVFGLPGLGQLIVTSIDHQDLPTIMGLVLLASTFVVVANIVVDVCYVLLDPRVRLSEAG
ncbi:MAG TPA: ABC transporter permease [Acidimicrobiales bacterium]